MKYTVQVWDDNGNLMEEHEFPDEESAFSAMNDNPEVTSTLLVRTPEQWKEDYS